MNNKIEYTNHGIILNINKEMSFHDIIAKLFSFDKYNLDKNIFDIHSLFIITDYIEGYNFNVNYSNKETYNEILLTDPETGEIIIIIEQNPCLVPDLPRWLYRITYISWDFNPSLSILEGFAILN